MQSILDAINEWIKEILIGAINGNLSTMFGDVNEKVGTIANEVGQTPQGWNANIFSMIQTLSENVIVPIAGLVITYVLCYELISMVTEKNNMHDIDTFMFFKWIFKAFVAVFIVTNTFNITMAVFDMAQHIVSGAAGVIGGDTNIDVAEALAAMQEGLEDMEIPELLLLAWLANPDYFINYAALIIFVSFAALAIPLAISIRKRNKADAIFRRFLLEPDDTNEYLLCEAVPAVIRPLICELGKHLRTQQEYINEQKITVTDYEHYVENWVHEIKKPLSLMTLLLDNRKDEMSPLVHTRMLYVRDHTRQDIEQILYFSRLGATHKDYSFESLSILGTCREAVEDNLTLLEEAGFSIEYTENDYQVISDKKGLMFILGQIISNSVKYVGNNLAPRLIFSIADSMNSEQISLSIKDNGTSIPLSDLPFVFDKGFTGDTGSYLSRSTGMGLYLVQKMATDLFITVELKNNSYGGTTVTLTFPKV